MRTSISLWSADPRSVDGVLSRVGSATDSFHIDVANHAHSQEPLLGPTLIQALRARTPAPIEVHLLVPDPAAWIDRCAQAGASTIILPCASDDVRPLLQQVRASGVEVALSLDIGVPVDAAMEHFDLIDKVIVMGCARDVRGADLHPAVPGRIRTLVEARRLNNESPSEPAIFVEGAVREHTLHTLATAGSDGVIVGPLVLAAADPLSVIHDINALTAFDPPATTASHPTPERPQTVSTTAPPSIAVTDLIGSGLAPTVARPQYDRREITAGIAHIGVGNFHRVHQALYVDACLHLPNHSHWGIIGIGLGDSSAARTKAAAYTAQNSLYTVTEYGTGGNVSSRLVGAMIDYRHAPADPEAVLALLTAPNIRIVSLTITEGGYNLDEATGQFKIDDLDVQHDLQAAHPRTAFGYITEALRRRRANGTPVFTVMSCDNLRSNGDTTRTAVLGYATAKDPALAQWISTNVAFPNSMVDRIAPAVTDEVKRRLNDQTGVQDQMPAIAETFSQWVLEDNFPTGRPAFEQVGVELRDDVAAFEAIKGRMLNACHMLLVYPALLSGHRLVHEAMTDIRMVDLLMQFLQLDVMPHIQGPAGVSLGDYAAAILDRFANPAVGDQLLRIAGDGASKLPTFHTKTISLLLAGHHDIRREALVIAGFRKYTRGTDDLSHTYDVDEPHLKAADWALLNSDDPVDALRISPFASLNLADHPDFVDHYLQLTSHIDDHGMAATTLGLTSNQTLTTSPSSV